MTDQRKLGRHLGGCRLGFSPTHSLREAACLAAAPTTSTVFDNPSKEPARASFSTPYQNLQSIISGGACVGVRTFLWIVNRHSDEEDALLPVDFILFVFWLELHSANRANNFRRTSWVVPSTFPIQLDEAALARRFGDIFFSQIGGHGGNATI